LSEKKKNKHLIPPQEIKYPSWDPSKTLYDWSPENISFDDPTVCALCQKVDCICTVQVCPCQRKATHCKWPSESCPCPMCDKLMVNCKCTVIIKGENK